MGHERTDTLGVWNAGALDPAAAERWAAARDAWPVPRASPDGASSWASFERPGVGAGVALLRRHGAEPPASTDPMGWGLRVRGALGQARVLEALGRLDESPAIRRRRGRMAHLGSIPEACPVRRHEH